jgi:hypothetical protein
MSECEMLQNAIGGDHILKNVFGAPVFMIFGDEQGGP